MDNFLGTTGIDFRRSLRCRKGITRNLPKSMYEIRADDTVELIPNRTRSAERNGNTRLIKQTYYDAMKRPVLQEIFCAGNSIRNMSIDGRWQQSIYSYIIMYTMTRVTRHKLLLYVVI